MKYLILMLLFMTSCAHRSSIPKTPTPLKTGVTQLEGWSRWTVPAKDGSLLDVYGVVDDVRRPVLVMIIGSRCQPLFRSKGEKVVSPLLEKDASFFRKQGVHVLALERRGIKSFEPLPEDIEKLDGRLRCSKKFGGLTKEDRISDSQDAILSLSREPWFGDLILMGHSEGGDIISGLSNQLDNLKIKSLGFFAAAGTSQFYGHILQARKAQDSKRLEETFSGLFYASETDATGKFGGYPVERIKSFAIASTPLDDVLENQIPIFTATGSRDEKAPIEDADIFAVEVIRKQPSRKVLYLNYTELNHDLENKEGNDLSREVLSDFLKWTQDFNPERKFILK
jgi:esterase/lipase